MDLVTQLSVAAFFTANIIFCLAYIVRNILWLRIFTVIAAFLTFPYFIFQKEVLVSALIWQSMFALINIVNIARLLNDKRTVDLTDDETLLKNLVFRNFTGKEIVKLIGAANWKASDAGHVLIHEDEAIGRLYLLFEGSVDIYQTGNHLTRRAPGAFLGEVHFMTGESATAQVVISENARYLEWNNTNLRNLLDREPRLAKAFESLLAVNMASKLRDSANAQENKFATDNAYDYS